MANTTSSDCHGSLRDSIARLFTQQLASWPTLAENCQRLADSTPRRLGNIGLWEISALCLNHRSASATAKTDPRSIASRPCFLCSANRPEPQQSVLWRDYEILANPFPIAPGHLTIPLRSHSPQRISGRIADMAQLATLLPDKCLFYNGPRCGASAPDHFHFQAFDAAAAPNIFIPLSGLREINSPEGVSIFTASPPLVPFPFFIIEASAPQLLASTCEHIIASLPQDLPEPMLNIAMAMIGSRLRALIIPRKAHRPANYGTGPQQMLISPATVEMLGTFVCSRPDDFNSLDLDTVLSIYSQVSLSTPQFLQISASKPS